MSRRTIITCLLAASLALTGCHTCRRQEAISNRPCDNCGQPAPPRLRATPLPPFRQPPAQPPIATIGGPTPAGYQEPSGGSPAPETPRQPDGTGDAPPNPPTPENDFPPAGGPAVKLGVPYRVAPDRRRSDDFEGPRAEAPAPRKRTKEEEKSTPRDDETAHLLNVKNVVEGVYSGFKPDAVAHFRWLADNDFRTVLNLRPPDSNDAEVKRHTFKNKMTYRSINVSAERLTLTTYEQFVQAVNNTEDQRLYVCDRDGTVAGGLWYLYFRFHKKYSDADAKTEAKDLGLDFADESKSNRDILLAVQTLSNLLQKDKGD